MLHIRPPPDVEDVTGGRPHPHGLGGCGVRENGGPHAIHIVQVLPHILRQIDLHSLEDGEGQRAQLGVWLEYASTVVSRVPLRGGFLRETPLIILRGTVLTGRADPLREGPGSLTGPSQRRTTKRLTGRQGHYGGPLRRGTVPSQRRTTKRLTGRQGPYGKPLTRRSGPYGKGRSSEKLRGKTLPELGGNFRLCAVDQKRSFFPRVGPFLDFLPFKGPFPLTGALTGRPPYGKAPYGEASYGKAGPLQEAPYEEGRSLREGPGSRTGPSQRRTTKRLTGRPLTGRLLSRRPLTNYRKSYGDRLYQNWAGISACVP